MLGDLAVPVFWLYVTLICSFFTLHYTETRIKTIFHWPSLDQWSSAGCWPHFNQMLLQLIDDPHWLLINMCMHVGFSRCLQALLHWCGFMQPGVKVNGVYYCDVLLLKQLLPYCCCWRLLLSSARRVHKSTAATQDSGLHTRRGLSTDQTSVLWTIDYWKSFRNAFIRNTKGCQISLMSCGYWQNGILITEMTYYISQGRVETPTRRGW